MSVNIIIDSCSQEDWGRYARNFTDYSVYQTWAYQQVRAEHDKQRLKRIVIRDQSGREILMCHVRIKTIRPFGPSIGYVQSGPLMLRADGETDCLSEALRCLRDSCFRMNISVLRIAPNVANNEIGKKIEDLLESAGFKKNQRLAPYRTYIVSLEEDEQEIYARFNKDRRRIIRKAGNARIEVREGTDMESFRILENLYAEAKDRKGFKGLDSAEFAQTQQLLAQSEKAIILIAYCDGQPVTAHATTHFGVTAVPILSASTKMGLECGTPSLLFWKAYVIAKNLGMQYYDLGGIDPDENPKGYLFKKDMGGEESLHIGTFEAYTNPLMLRTFHMAEKCYRIIKKRA